MKRGTALILKASGEKEVFNDEKLRRSLLNAGAKKEAADAIVDHIRNELQDGMSTTHIYRHAFKLLRKIEAMPVAARYSVRRAVFGLGPTGFPFEEYVSEIFRAREYTVETGIMVAGKCAMHEVDMLAYNDTEYIGAELKFHNSPGIKTDLKVALYVRERFEDIKRGSQKEGTSPYINTGMLVTNTKFTGSVISYASCAGLKLLGWNYPKHDNLESLIQKTGIYPITTLTSLSQREKIQLLSSNMVICNGLESQASALEKAGVPKAKIGTVIDESQALCTLPDTIQ